MNLTTFLVIFSFIIASLLTVVVRSESAVFAIDLNPENFQFSPPVQQHYISKRNDTKKPSALSQRGEEITEAPLQPAPKYSFAVWDTDGTICVLAKFQASFSITYGASGGQKEVKIKMPIDLKTKGVCASEKKEPVLELMWPLFRFVIQFGHTPGDYKRNGRWFVSSFELLYNTASPNFQGALVAGKQTVHSQPNLTIFETPLGKSFFCPSQPGIQLFDNQGRKVAIVALTDIHMQPYQFTGGYSPVHRCSHVFMGGSLDPYVHDKSVPVTVGSILAALSCATVAAYGAYRSWFVKRVDYGTMQ